VSFERGVTVVHTARPAPPPDFDPVSEQGFRDPASLLVRAREEAPAFFYPPLGVWVVSRREDVERWITDVATFSNLANGGSLPVPEAFAERVPPSLMADIFVGMDPPRHTPARKAGQRGFTRGRIAALEPRIAGRAHRIIDGFAGDGSCDLMSRYCLELTTQTLIALLDLPPEDEPMLRRLRFDHFLVLASGNEPMPEPMQSDVWERYASAHERLRELADERADDPGEDVISAMASARDAEGNRVLSRERVALHVCEFAAAGTDTTAQLMGNAVVYLSGHEKALAEAQADPALWDRVVEETVRRRPSAPFVQRAATRDVEIAGVTIPEGDRVWFSLAGASNDPAHYDAPERFDIHRPNPDDHLGFSKGRHFCLGAPLGRAQSRVGLQVLFERLPSLRVDPDAPLDFADLALLPLRQSLPVRWTP
jgi:cytochrome P450